MWSSNSKINHFQTTTTTTTTSVDDPTTGMKLRWNTSALNPSSTLNQNDPGFSDAHNLIRDLLNTIYRFLGHDAIINFIKGSSLDNICEAKPYVLNILLNNNKYDTLLQPASSLFARTQSKELNDKVAAQLKDLCKFNTFFDKAARKAKVELLVSGFYKYENQERLVLSNHTFSELTLENEDFSEIGFNNCTFNDLALKYEDFSGIEFNNCTFKKCYLYEVKFNSSFIINTTFSKCTISNCKFKGANFQVTTSSICELKIFTKCYIRYCDFMGAGLEGEIFTTCNLTHCDFMGANLAKEIFTQCELSYCNFNNTEWQYDYFVATIIKNIASAKKYPIDKKFKLQNCTINANGKEVPFNIFLMIYKNKATLNNGSISTLQECNEEMVITFDQFNYCIKNNLKIADATVIDAEYNTISLEELIRLTNNNIYTVRHAIVTEGTDTRKVVQEESNEVALGLIGYNKVRQEKMARKISIDSILTRIETYPIDKIKSLISSIYYRSIIVDSTGNNIKSEKQGLLLVKSKLAGKICITISELNDIIKYGYEIKKSTIDANSGDFSWVVFKEVINNECYIEGKDITIYSPFYPHSTSYREFHAYTSSHSYNFRFKHTNILLESVIQFVIEQLCTGDLMLNENSPFSSLPKDLILKLANDLIYSIVTDTYDKGSRITDSNGLSRNLEQSFKFISECIEKYIENKFNQQENDLNVEP